MSIRRHEQSDLDLLPGLLPEPEEPDHSHEGPDHWIETLRGALADRSATVFDIADDALKAYPTHPEILLLAALTALAGQKTDRAMTLIKRYGKRYITGPSAGLLHALALGQAGRFAQALAMLHDHGLYSNMAAQRWFIGDPAMDGWLADQLRTIRARATASPGKTNAKPPPKAATKKPVPKPQPVKPTIVLPPIPAMPKLEARFDMAFEIANPDAIAITAPDPDPIAFRLRGELTRLSLFEGFDELLCLPALQGVEAHWYQVETVRKVLKQYRGRVLLADEVGLGKTIEAGMVLKEYVLRGMAERILILTPASLVGQWRDEMEAKFGIECATSHDPLLRSDPAARHRLDRRRPPQGPGRDAVRPRL